MTLRECSDGLTRMWRKGGSGILARRWAAAALGGLGWWLARCELAQARQGMLPGEELVAGVAGRGEVGQQVGQGQRAGGGRFGQGWQRCWVIGAEPAQFGEQPGQPVDVADAERVHTVVAAGRDGPVVQRIERRGDGGQRIERRRRGDGGGAGRLVEGDGPDIVTDELGVERGHAAPVLLLLATMDGMGGRCGDKLLGSCGGDRDECERAW